jgi:biopolymer transport protein ExbD
MKPLSAINVIPFIDIMLVLLAVVLTTATFVAQRRIPVDLPQAYSGVPIEQQHEVTELTVNDEGQLFLDDAPVTLEDFEAHLLKLDAITPVLLRVDGAAAFENFVAVVDKLKARGMTNLSIVTRRE